MPSSQTSSSESRRNSRDIKRNIVANGKYLLQLCLKYDWVAVERCCAFLVQIFQSQDSKHTKLIVKGSKQLLSTNQWGNNCLHIACHHKPPVSLITAILSAASKVPRGGLNLHTMVNSRNATPLAIACTSGASRKVIQELLNPPQGLESSGSTVSIVDNFGATPFQGLIKRYEMFLKIPSLKNKYKPLDQVDAVILDSDFDLDSVDEIWSLVEPSIFLSFWASINLLIKAAFECNTRGANSEQLRESLVSVVHGAAHVSESLPTKLTDLILRVHKNMIYFPTANGTLPLHLAVTCDTIRRQSQLNPQSVFQRAYFVEKVLEMDPLCASLPVPGNRRTPLCQAIASGLDWHIDNGVLPPLPGPVQRLWQAKPDALYTRDPVTGLYPCLLAATSSVVQQQAADDDDREEQIDDLYQLDTVYHLLRLYPQVFQEMLL
jgi:hypothetical protein